MAKRAVTYGADVQDAVIARLAGGETLRAICREQGMPNPSRVIQWCEEEPAFAQRYARARSAGLDVLADEMVTLADECREGEKTKRVETNDRACSECERQLKWQGAWKHAEDKSSICEGASANIVYQTEVTTADMVERSRLQLETRKWLLARLKPAVYGDHQKIEMDVTSGGQSWAEILRARRAKRGVVDVQAVIEGE